MDSILISVKKLVGISQEDTSFDTDLIIHINWLDIHHFSFLTMLTPVNIFFNTYGEI